MISDTPTMAKLLSDTDRFRAARDEIFEAHNEDPNKIAIGSREIPYETHYAEKMETYLSKRDPHASEALRLAICAQHFRRWEVPRSSYPMTKLGYHSWKRDLQKRQADLLGEILEKYYDREQTDRAMALVRKEGLKQAEEEVQVLEDVACLVFLDDQFDQFIQKHDEEKIVNVLKKSWVKMSPKGHEMALEIPMTDECKVLVQKALNG